MFSNHDRISKCHPTNQGVLGDLPEHTHLLYNHAHQGGPHDLGPHPLALRKGATADPDFPGLDHNPREFVNVFAPTTVGFKLSPAAGTS